MTLNELFDQVTALGFEDMGELSRIFVYAARRAQRFICTELGPTECATVHTDREDVCYRLDRVFLAEKPLELPVCGCALSFSYTGNGYYTVGDTRFELSGSGTVRISKSPSDAVTLVSSGKLFIQDLSLFATLADEDNIPLVEKITTINLRDRIPSIAFAVGTPKTTGGIPLPLARTIGTRIIFPSDYLGDIRVDYKRLPTPLSMDTPDEDIDIPLHLDYLLPLLTAAFYLVDDDEEKAAYYMGLYRAEAAKIRATVPQDTDTQYVDVTGWA